MADKKASLILSLEDFVSKGIGSIAAKLAVLRQGVLAVKEAFTTIINVLDTVLSAYGEQEAAVIKLNQALKNQSIQSQAVTDDLIAFANQIQKTTVYADEAVLGAMALGTTFGLTGDKLKATTQAAADMSSALGIDLRTTMMLLGKASVGETGTLSRYGIVISDNIPKAEKFAAALSQVNSRFGGSASAEAGTYSGQIAQLKNTFDELLESLGKRFIGPASAFLKWIKEATIATADYLGLNEKTNGVYGSQIDSLNKLIKAERERITLFKEHGGSAKEEEARLSTLEKSLAWYEKQNKAISEQQRIKAEAGAKGGIATEDTEEEKRQAKLLQEAQNEIDTAGMTEQEIAEIKSVSMALELEAAGRHEEAKTLIQIKGNEDRKKNMLSTLSTISTMSNSHNKTLAAFGKAAAISTATIDTYSAANKALASAPPPWNFALAALVTAAGLSNVASISGVKLAEGGMIMPRSGGTSAIMAEAGKAEVAIPLDDERTKDKLRETLGGAGGTTIIVQAGAIVADDYSINEFVQKIDEKLFERQRNRRSYL